MGTDPRPIGACAATKAATRAALARSGNVDGSRAPNKAPEQRVQRRREAQRLTAAAPTCVTVLVPNRTAFAVNRFTAHNASAHAIAANE